MDLGDDKMTRDDIMHLANETAGRDGWGCEGHLQRFADLVVAAEREACAKVCRDIMDDFWIGDDRWETARHCSEMILERGNK